MSVRFSSKALRDLVSITQFIAQDNPTRAQTFVDELEAACNDLATQADRFAIVPELGNRYRRRPYGSYSIVYRSDGSSVRIVRIIHSARNVSEVFKS